MLVSTRTQYRNRETYGRRILYCSCSVYRWLG